ncbi:MAG: S-layer homology domain-containing protein [Candidatus Margulisbacteria bacterium]|nr:S-layer homology domain-containing protein [Candidatus Margulisiibacteriota bacterium]
MKKLLTILTILILAAGAALAQGGGYVPDPMSIGVGARALGMGRAYVGVAEDGDALFVNPAGIARVTNPKLSSMYSSLMSDVNYMVVGGVYPYGENSAIGAGIVNAYTADIPLTNSNGTPVGTGTWGNSVMFLSAGTYLKNLPAFKTVDKDVMVGGSFKYHSVGGTGSNDVADVADAAGTGYSVDLGVLYPATDYLTLGANYQNVLASKMTRSSGINETIPSTLKVGGKMCLIGREGQAYTIHDSRRLYLNADYDINSDNSGNVPHLGLEFWPVGNLALRAGMDNKDLTAGLGIRLGGLEFNYAYHPYSGINENATSFFSISYLGEAAKRALRIVFESPGDKAVIYNDHIKVAGRVEAVGGDGTESPTGPITVKVNGVVVTTAKDNTFSAEVPVDRIGKKLLIAEASDTAGDYTQQEFRLLRLISFADVPEGYWAKQPIENTGTVGLVEGYPDGTFKPDRALTRAELATLMVRAKGIKIPEGPAKKVFKDVNPDFWAAKYIEVAKREGLIECYPDKSFRPNNKINKVEGIAILVRFENMKVAYEVYEKPYWDMSAKHWGAKYVQAAKEYGMLKYVDRNYLHPKEALSRAESVEMLSKTSLAGTKIKDLYTWELGFNRETIPERPNVRAAM